MEQEGEYVQFAVLWGSVMDLDHASAFLPTCRVLAERGSQGCAEGGCCRQVGGRLVRLSGQGWWAARKVGVWVR